MTSIRSSRTFARALVRLGSILCVASLGAVVACGAADESSDDSNATNADALTSKTIHSQYGMTTFGGAGDYQSLACGGNSRTSQPYYVASNQRYGCHAHLQLVAPNGKCVVVETEDVGPASFVESRAGMAILDASPTVSEYLFGTSGLGWSDVKAHPSKYVVQTIETTSSTALGPCKGLVTPIADGGLVGSGSDSGSSSSSGGTGGGTQTTPPSGATCKSDGQCNPGGNGSGQICVSGHCVDGCNSDWQCPGSTSCQDGMCQ